MAENSFKKIAEFLKPLKRSTTKTLNGLGDLLTFTGNIGSTCELGIQKIALTPGASSCCGSGCSSCSSCCW